MTTTNHNNEPNNELTDPYPNPFDWPERFTVERAEMTTMTRTQPEGEDDEG